MLPPNARQSLQTTIAILLGAAVTYCVYGYQFGTGNHGVYLLDALRTVDPTLLQHDWFTTHTLQYHFLFTKISAALMRLGILQSGFATIYITLILLFHIAWRGIVRHFHGGDGAYLLSVALYHLSAAGTGLGMYQFFQDSSVLPSNIANVALLWAIWMWLIDRRFASGICIGLAGIFHLNHALVGSGLWIALSLAPPIDRKRRRSPAQILGTLAALVPSGLNVAYAAQSKLTRSDAMPLGEFVELYVRLRHPHHYDPSSWPIAIWVAFIWTILPAILFLRGQAIRIYLLLMFLVVVALSGAGLFYVSETLIQMSLFRFSIYLQLLGCIACGVLIERCSLRTLSQYPGRGVGEGSAGTDQDGLARSEPSPLPSPSVLGEGGRVPRVRKRSAYGVALCIVIITICIVRGPFFGMFRMPGDDADYRRLCEWVAGNTPVDAILLVPPDEESMRLIGRRAIVINYKCVPQLSAELSEWRDRLCDVMNLRDLTSLPYGYTKILPAMRKQYEQMPSDLLIAAARKYGARYLVATHSLQGLEERRVNIDATGVYILYDLDR